ncbi:gluconokinase [Pontibacter cellulosilyticus]|uniref:Gluconokinase n=1 Tax=Pontibacter cellulosilyticus TaxID=1720253 RepID=A0A923N860_9BACT|nr:gluconokinase [Pontibacter cellulosilyticus]MBC5992642.1 gluconokinase [Pontibacter cellulosilyticus]
MTKQAVIGIDIGTTSTKAVAFDAEAKPVFHYAVAYPIINTKPNFAEQDPELVFDAVLSCLKAVVQLLCDCNYELKGVCFSSAMHSLIALDKKGNLLTNCIIWADARSMAQAANLKNSVIGHSIYLHTGTPLHPMSPLPKICWLRESNPSLFREAAKFIGIKEYVFYKLYGEYKIDYSIASATGLFNIFDLNWHSDALEMAGISTSQLSEPVPASYTFSGMKRAYADKLGINADLPFVIGASDGCLANLGADAVCEGDAVVTIGTSGAIRVTADKPATDLKERIFSYVLTPEKYILGGAVNNGGIVLQWFRDNFYGAEAEVAKVNEEDIFTMLNAEAASVAPGSDGLLFLPYLLGERSPHWNAAARACFFGVHYTHGRAHFLRALMEGIIFGLYSVGMALEQTMGPVKRIYANGGFTHSDLWVQMLADVFNVEVRLTDTAEGSALGAALLGMHTLGMIKNLEDAGKLLKVQKTFTPNVEANRIYMRNYALFEDLYPKLESSFSQAVHLNHKQSQV